MIITKDIVKSMLSILDNNQDIKIDTYIPIAEGKFREIANYSFNAGVTVSGLKDANFFEPADLGPDSFIYYLKFGDIVEGANITPGTYIISIDILAGRVYLSSILLDDIEALMLGQNISYYPTISALVYFLMNKGTQAAQNQKEITSKSVGPLSISFSEQAINKTFGLPQVIVDAIPKYAGLS